MPYSFIKKGTLIPTPKMPGPGPYYISIVPLSEIENNTYDYALYYSTDHNPGEGGIWAYFCKGKPTEAENWLSVEEAYSEIKNPIYLDNIQGNGHTETPYANIVNGEVYLSYHKNGIPPSQATLMATSSDGIHFKRINDDEDSVILCYDTEKDPGDGHTGYFRWSKNPFKGRDWQYIGYSLHGGTNNYYSSLWGSNDGKQWTRLEILIPTEGQALNENDQMIIWHELDPSSIRSLGNGEYSAICAVGNRASGAAARIVELYEIFLAEDGCTLTRQSQKVLGVEDGLDSEELASPVLIDDHLVYVGASEQGKQNTILLAQGTFSESPLPEPLSREEGSKHIFRT